MVYKTVLILIFVIITLSSSLTAQEKYAVLITGDYADGVFPEFWHDTYLMWEMLESKGFTEANIFVLFADEEDYNNHDNYSHPKVAEGKTVTDFSATKANVDMVFNGLANGDAVNNIPQMTEDDFLVVWVFDHGHYGWPNNNIKDAGYKNICGLLRDSTKLNKYYYLEDSTIAPMSSIDLMNNNSIVIQFLCASQSDWITNWDDSWIHPGGVTDIDEDNSILPNELNNYLNAIQVYKKVVIMQQCFGGGFIDELKNSNTIILTASEYYQTAKSVDQKYKYSGTTYTAENEMELQPNDTSRFDHGEFDYHLFNALKGLTPDRSTYYEISNLADIPLADADENDDGIVTINEAFTWQYLMNSRRATPKWSDVGSIGSMTSLEYPTVLSENITSSMTIRGDIAVTNTISVSSGATLTIKPGAVLKFKPGKSIAVYGTLNAVGTSSKSIKFTSIDDDPGKGDWFGVRLYSSSSVMKYCEIEYAQYGIYIYNTTQQIEQCYMHDNTYGSYVNYLADPVFYYNTFSDNDYGVYCYWSEAHFGEPHEGWGPPHPGYNDIINNDVGIRAGFNSDVFLGIDAGMMALGGYNSLDANNTDISAVSSSSVSAEHNWWNFDGPDCYADGSSSVITYNALPPGEEPNGGSSLAKSAAGDENKFNPDNVDKNNPDELLQLARYYKYIGNYKEALESLETLINNFPETNYAALAMLQIYSISKKSDIVDIEACCKEKISDKETSEPVKRTSHDILVSKYMREGKDGLAKDLCNDILSYYPGTESEKFSLFNLFLMSCQDESKAAEADDYKSALEEKYPNDHLTLEAKSISGENVDWSLAKEVVKESKEITEESVLPVEFALHPAYPNPFNPSTTISFDLPEASKINLDVYNVRGQKVWSYSQNNTEFSAGKHSVVWQGTNISGSSLPSGMYFIKFHTGNFTANQKIIFIK